MKRILAKRASIVLMALGSFFVFTNTFWNHRPEAPAEWIRK